MENWLNIVLGIIILILAAFLYNRFQDKADASKGKEGYSNYEELNEYLLQSPTDLETKKEEPKKPILWIHIPNGMKNSRNWLSFGSRLTNELNQPYLYLTVKSIIKNCKDTFRICMIDDESFEKLIPSWNIDMKQVSSPIIQKLRQIGLMKLLSVYGGMIVPISFLCMKDLKGLYEKGTRDGKAFICENVDRGIHSTQAVYYPDIHFMGVGKPGNSVIGSFLSYIEETLSSDFTSESVFLDKFNVWMNDNACKKQITLIDGIDVGVKDMEGDPISLEGLMSDNYIDFYSKMYGIWIPQKDLLKRLQYGWFVRSSPKQVLEGNSILSKYMLLANTPQSGGEYLIEQLRPDPDWVGFYDTPLTRIWGLKPNYLGNTVLKYANPENPGT
jgi:hypothetical protein